MDRSRKGNGEGVAAPKGYYGGRVEFYRFVSVKRVVITSAVFGVVLAAFVAVFWLGPIPLASVLLIAAGVALTNAVREFRKYTAERVIRKVFYYDVHSPYPEQMMRGGTTRPFLAVTTGAQGKVESVLRLRKEKRS